jgi:regulatory protein
MKVTGLKQQVNRPSRYSVYIDGKFAFGLSTDALLASKLVTGEELPDARFRELRALSAEDKTYGNAIRYATLRQRSEWEMATYLKRKGADKKLAEDILSRLRGLDLLNDLSFARTWVANRRLLKAVSKRRLIQELYQKHVDGSIVDIVLSEDETDESAVLRELVAKKRQIPRYRDDLKLMQHLARQGYDYDAVKSALRDADE